MCQLTLVLKVHGRPVLWSMAVMRILANVQFCYKYEGRDQLFIIIMRNKLLIILFASTVANFLDLVLPKTCP